jgi:hypothetical protein
MQDQLKIEKITLICQYCPEKDCRNRSLYNVYKNGIFLKHLCDDHIESVAPNDSSLVEVLSEIREEREKAMREHNRKKVEKAKRELVCELKQKPTKRRLFVE